MAHRAMTRIDLHWLMGEPVEIRSAKREPGVKYVDLRAPATEEELLARFKQCAEQVRAMAKGDTWQGGIADLEEAMLEMPLTPEDEDETGFDGNGLLSDLAIFVHAYQKIGSELYERKKEADAVAARAKRATKRQSRSAAVA